MSVIGTQNVIQHNRMIMIVFRFCMGKMQGKLRVFEAFAGMSALLIEKT
jgi:hypothetical protein